MIEALTLLIKNTIKDIYEIECSPLSEPTDNNFGDMSTNIALQIAGRLGQNPTTIAKTIAESIKNSAIIEEVNVAGPGFINVRFKLESHAKVVEEIIKAGDGYGANNSLQGLSIVAEYSDPNPFKVLHAGHLYTSLVGDSMSNLLEIAGAIVHRVNFGGDVGLHVGKSMWAIIKTLGGENPEKLSAIKPEERLDWISKLYVDGNEAYETDEVAKNEIIATNKQVYQLHDKKDKTSNFAQIYWTCREWSYDGFNSLYKKLNMKPFEKYYPESETSGLGVEAVKEGLDKGIFEESDGAVVYKGEKDGLHTRVFITSEGLPTYEAKDLGLALKKWDDYHFDQNIMITGNDIIEYMKVVQAALKNINPDIIQKSRHFTHGIVKLAGGVKMSSRKGNILRADDILHSAQQAYQNTTGKDDWGAVLAAVKYAFLRQRIGGDIIYNPEESVSITGNSGPYLQYSHARARSIISKAKLADTYTADQSELELLKKLQEYKYVVSRAVEDMMPHHVATYLFELSQTFNSLYEKERVLGSKREAERALLMSAYTQILKNGLALLGIEAPETI